MLFLVLACFFLNIVLSVHAVDNKVIFYYKNSIKI